MGRRKRWPAPPPTPKGKVWRTVDYGGVPVTKLIPAVEAKQHAMRVMAAYDALPPFVREEMMGS
jgi:hypothetical protein